MIEFIYFGMIPIIVFALMIVHKLGYVDVVKFLELDADNQGAAIGAIFALFLWPFLALVGVGSAILYVLYLILDLIADKIVSIIKKKH